jgi:putrescine transport system permease protein
MSVFMQRAAAIAPGWLRGRHVVIGLPLAWLTLFFLVPFLIVLDSSVSEMGVVRAESVVSVADGVARISIKYSNYLALASDSLYVTTYLASLKMAAVTTLLCLLLGYPFAYFMARAQPRRQAALLLLVMLPFWTSFLLRVYAWKALLSTGGWVANVLMALNLDTPLAQAGLISAPGNFLNSPFALVVGMTYTYLPFMILPLFANLAKMDLRLLEAAADLGATPLQAFWRVTVPLSKAGIVAGSMLVFIPCVGEYVIPSLLGGPQALMIGHVLWDEFFGNNDWPMASTVAVVLVLLIVAPLAVFNRYQTQAQGGRR